MSCRLGLLVVFLGALSGVSAAAVLSGQLSVADGGVLASGAWNDANTVFAWEVTDPIQSPSGKWRYYYTLTVPQAGVGKLLVELQFHVLIGDLVNKSWTGQAGQTAEVRSYTLAGDATTLPDLPDDIYGITFNVGGGPTTVVAQFDTAHAPTWGDFYSAAGESGPTVWNEGFPLADPTDPPTDGSLLNHVLVPGPSTGIPEPATATLLLAGGMLAAVRRRRP